MQMGQTHGLLRVGLTNASNVGDVLHEIPHLHPRYQPVCRRCGGTTDHQGNAASRQAAIAPSHKLREMFELHTFGDGLSDLLQLGDVLHRIKLLYMFRRDPRQAQILQPFERQLCVVSH